MPRFGRGYIGRKVLSGLPRSWELPGKRGPEFGPPGTLVIADAVKTRLAVTDAVKTNLTVTTTPAS